MSIARQIVGFAIKAGSSDIHLEEGSPIAIRVNSDIRILQNVRGSEDRTSLRREIGGEEKLEQDDKLTPRAPRTKRAPRAGPTHSP